MANQPKQTRENKETIWSADLRVKVGQTVKYDGSFWVNLTGLNSEPGIGTDFEPQGTPAIEPIIDGSIAESANPVENAAIKAEFDRTNDDGVILDIPLVSEEDVNALNYKTIVKNSGVTDITLSSGLDDDFNFFYLAADPITFVEDETVTFDGDLETLTGSIIIDRPMKINRVKGTNIFYGYFTDTRVTGWGSYVDTVYTSGSPLAVLANTDTLLPNNKGSVIETQKPDDVATFYDGTVITGRNGDSLDIQLYFKAVPSVVDQWLDIWIDITGGAGTPANFAYLYLDTKAFPKGAGFERGFIYSIPSAYTLETWETNGAVVKVRSNAAINIYDIVFNFDRSHKAKL